MRMKLYITTLGRLEDQKTLRNLTPDLRRRTYLVVQAHEYIDHMDKYGDQCAGVIALPEHIDNLGETRRYMRGLARMEGAKTYCLLDDDIEFYIRRDPGDWRLTSPTEEELNKMFDEVEDRLLSGYMHVGVSGREGNNRVPDYGVENTRYMRMLCYRTDMPDGADPGRINGMSDFDLNLQLLRRRCASYVFFRYAQGQRATQSPGGCAINRTHETHEKEVDWMVEEHHPFVKKRYKVNRTGGEFGKRAEVTIHWQKAYKTGDLA